MTTLDEQQGCGLPDPNIVLHTERLTLRRAVPSDARRAFEIRSRWAVTRNLSRAQWPPDRGQVRDWFATFEGAWLEDKAYRFAICRHDTMIGLSDLERIAKDSAELGYWLDQGCWGHGFATEAAGAVVRFADAVLALPHLRATHAEDNPTSGRVLAKLGFQRVGDVTRQSRSRGGTVRQVAWRRTAPGVPAQS